MVLAHDSSLAPAGLLTSALDGRDGPAAVRAIVTGPLENGVAELLEAALPSARPRSLQLLRSKYKPSRKLTGYYTVADGEALVRRHVAVTWTADGGVGLLVSPTDPAMPEIGRLAAPPVLGRLVEELSGPGRPTGSPRVTTVRYRPGQRHVLEARYPSGPAVYVKVDRDASGARAVPVAHALRDVFLGAMPEAGIVQPVGFSPPDRAALWWEAPGQVLAALVRSGSGAATAVEQVGRAVRVIHESASTPGEHPALDAVRTRAVESEVAGTVRAGEHIAALLPEVGAIYADVVADVVTRLDRLPIDGPTFTHGDLKSENLLVDSGRLHVLDLDRACWTEPAMDLGKFVADLRWWSRSPRAAAELEAAFRAGYGEGDPIRWARADLLATLFEVKFAARRCFVHDPHWSSRVRAQVARAAPPSVATRSR